MALHQIHFHRHDIAGPQHRRTIRRERCLDGRGRRSPGGVGHRATDGRGGGCLGRSVGLGRSAAGGRGGGGGGGGGGKRFVVDASLLFVAVVTVPKPIARKRQPTTRGETAELSC